MLASARGDVDMVKLLLAWGADKYKQTDRDKTFALWLASKHGHIEVMRLLMNVTPESEAGRTRIVVDIPSQKATLYRDDVEVKSVPVSTGRKSSRRQRGRYLITDKHKIWTSNLYEAKMPFFMRLSCGAVGLHAGYLPGYPASHGCIRMPEATAMGLVRKGAVGHGWWRFGRGGYAKRRSGPRAP